MTEIQADEIIEILKGIDHGVMILCGLCAGIWTAIMLKK